MIIALAFPIPGVIAQFFNTTAEILIPVGMPTKESKKCLKPIQ